MKTTKGLLFLSFTLVSLFFVPQVLAETASPSARPNPKRQEIRVKIEEKRVEKIEKLSATRRERIMNFSNKMIVRLEATVERIEKLISKIEERILKIEAGKKDIDVAKVKESLDEAKQSLALIKIEVTLFKESLGKIPDAEDPKVVFKEVRETLKGIKEDLKDVHSMLVKLIGDIKGLRVGDNKNE